MRTSGNAFHEAGHAVAMVAGRRALKRQGSVARWEGNIDYATIFPWKSVRNGENAPGGGTVKWSSNARWGGMVRWSPIWHQPSVRPNWDRSDPATAAAIARNFERPRQRIELSLVIALAGPRAVMRRQRRGEFAAILGGGMGDYATAEDLLEDFNALSAEPTTLKHFEKKTAAFVRREWMAIEALAHELDRRKRLSGREVNAIVRPLLTDGDVT